MSFQVFGIAVSQGVAIGRAVLVGAGRVDVAHYFVDEADVAREAARCRAACEEVAAEMIALKRDLPLDAPLELAALLDVHLMLVRDEAFVGAALEWITQRRYNAEWALSAQMEALARQFDEMEDEYLRERKSDLEQIVSRVLQALAREAQGGVATPQISAVRDQAGEDPLLLVAADIAPADLMGFRQGVFKGFITDMGGRTSHTAIVARSMDIPAVVGTREASRLIRQDDWVIIDGDAGVAIVDPSPAILEEYRFRQRRDDLERQRLALWRHKPAVTLDGERVEMFANIELPADAATAVAAGADGVGLFRTEFLFMNRGGRLPTEEEQYVAYRDTVLALGGRPLTLRTVDVGADKPLERAHAGDNRHDNVLNPALGLRAIRWSLAEPVMFRQQLRAVFRAAVHGPVRLLIPMVAHLSELRQVHDAVARIRNQWAGISDAPLPSVELGIMVEVPAAALILDRVLPLVDFVSIGTNDLIQYTLAIDRADESVAHLYDPWHPAVLRLIQNVITQARAAGKAVSVCGEMAGDPSFTALLLGMGLRSFSMNPPQISTIKQRILRADTQKLAAATDEVMGHDQPQHMAQQLGLG
jgi:phosphotransferase system enzyme I (PtsI)